MLSLVLIETLVFVTNLKGMNDIWLENGRKYT